MYQQFYGLRDIPFSLAPDPNYLFRTDSMLEVFANLQYGIESGKGLVVVTGEVGTGKTTVIRWVLQSLDQSMLAAYIFNPLLSTQEFFELLAADFGLRPQPSKAAMLRALGHALTERHSQGLRTVLVVDEAHLLPPHLLEEIRLLSNFETNRDKLLQVILCGQPELQELFLQPALRQLKQRVSLRCSIQPLSEEETGRYISSRLRIAGAANEDLFDAEAVKIVYQFSGGIPRLVNNICDNALLTGFSQASPAIGPGIIRTVVEDLDLAPMVLTQQQPNRAPSAGWNDGSSHAVDKPTILQFARAAGVAPLDVAAASPDPSETSRDSGPFEHNPRFVLTSSAIHSENKGGFFSRVKAERTA